LFCFEEYSCDMFRDAMCRARHMCHALITVALQDSCIS